jgi:heme A synthase
MAALNRMEFLMSIKTRIAAVVLAALAVTGTIASTTTQAQAKPFGWGWGVGAGLVGAAIVGSAIAASNDGYYYDGGYRRCVWVRQFDAYGTFVGRVRNCGY